LIEHDGVGAGFNLHGLMPDDRLIVLLGRDHQVVCVVGEIAHVAVLDEHALAIADEDDAQHQILFLCGGDGSCEECEQRDAEERGRRLCGGPRLRSNSAGS
jgi:hypothetical protein